MGLYSGGLIIGRIFASEIWGAYFREGLFWGGGGGGLLSEFYGIPILSPGPTFVQKAFLLGLFSGELILGGACYRKEFSVSK